MGGGLLYPAVVMVSALYAAADAWSRLCALRAKARVNRSIPPGPRRGG